MDEGCLQFSVISDHVTPSEQSGAKITTFSNWDNFFVRRCYELRFSQFFCQDLIRSFPVSFFVDSVFSGLSMALMVHGIHIVT